MKTLETLLKLAEKKVEAVQEEIAKLNAVMQEMDLREDYLNQKMESETHAANASSDGLLMAQSGLFFKRSMAEIKDIQEARVDAKRIMKEKQTVLKGHFAEQKRFEILLERKRAERLKEIHKKQQAELDDLGASFFNAKEKDA